MDERKGELISAAKRIVELFYRGEALQRSEYYEEGMGCITGVPEECPGQMGSGQKIFAGGISGIIHGGYRIVVRTNLIAIITGSYCTAQEGESRNAQKERYEVTLVLKFRESEIKIKHIHISKAYEGAVYEIRDIKERIYRFGESDIFYLESEHNHLLWHCRNAMVETVGALKDVEGQMSGEFVRIHRGFLVNKKHVYKIDRCYAELDNGEQLPIPVKKYCEVKKKLLAGSLCAGQNKKG